MLFRSQLDCLEMQADSNFACSRRRGRIPLFSSCFFSSVLCSMDPRSVYYEIMNKTSKTIRRVLSRCPPICDLFVEETCVLSPPNEF